MQQSPVSVLIGVIAVMFGVVIIYAGIRNKRVFGKDGIIPTALTTGTLSNLQNIPPMWK